MGFFSKKSTSTTLATSTNTGVSDVSGVAVVGNNNAMLDGGAIAGAFDFAGNAYSDSLKFAGEHDSRQWDALDKLIDSGSSLYKATASQADQNGNTQKLLLYIVGAVVAVVALQAFAK